MVVCRPLNKSAHCCKASLAFSLSYYTSKFVLLHFQVTSGLNMSTSEIRQNRTSAFFLCIVWTSAFKDFDYLVCSMQNMFNSERVHSSALK